jgi:hypothetical protein
MNPVSRFSSSFVGKAVTSGSKVQGRTFPALTVASTKDKFVLNSKALALMGLSEGSYVVMIDMNKGNVVTENPNERFYLTAGWDKGKGNFEGAKIGKGGSFSYSGVYSAIIMGKPEISEANIKDMAAAGKGILRVSNAGTPDEKETFIGTQKVEFKVEKLVQPNPTAGEPDLTEFEVSSGVFQTVYALTEQEITAHTPRTDGKPDDDETAE